MSNWEMPAGGITRSSLFFISALGVLVAVSRSCRAWRFRYRLSLSIKGADDPAEGRGDLGG